jgi:hypothetical protein
MHPRESLVDDDAIARPFEAVLFRDATLEQGRAHDVEVPLPGEDD